MFERRRNKSFLDRAGRRLDGLVAMVSPKAAFNRQRFRFAYDILDGGRLRRQRNLHRQGGNQELSERNLDKLRQICRDLATNNPLVKGLFRKLATNVVGTQTRIQARTEDTGWNQAAEQAVKEEMIDNTCDATGRLNFHGYIYKSYYRYGLDGDIFTVFTGDGPRAFQGEFCGTPYGSANILDPKHYDIINGLAISKQTGRVVGYYIGKPNKWGYIQPGGYKKYPPEVVHHMLSLERFDHSRGEPMLTSAVDIIDKLFGYVDAELVAAKINACFPMVAKTYDANSMAGPLGSLTTSKGTDQKDDYERPLVRMEPGQIWEGEPGESLDAVGAARPSQVFDSFVMRMLMFIGNPMCLPLMLTTGDFSHATFMNGRFAYNEARAFWKDEQELVVRPLVRKMWLWKIRQLIDRNVLTNRDDWQNHQIYMKRWPYVDPFREAQADKIHLENATSTRTGIVARNEGTDWSEEVWPVRVKEEKEITDSGIVLSPKKQNNQTNGGQK